MAIATSVSRATRPKNASVSARLNLICIDFDSATLFWYYFRTTLTSCLLGIFDFPRQK
jgi:hypothetical protein